MHVLLCSNFERWYSSFLVEGRVNNVSHYPDRHCVRVLIALCKLNQLHYADAILVDGN